MSVHTIPVFIQLMIFAGANIFYLWFIRKKNPAVPMGLVERPLAFTLSLAIILFLVSAGTYALAGKPGFLVPLASACAFILPCILQLAWREYLAIPSKQYPVWYAPVNGSFLDRTFTGNHVGVVFQFYLSDQSEKETDMLASLPLRQSLGNAFAHFLLIHNQQTDTIVSHLLDDQGYPFGWQFFVLRWYGFRKKFLDPKMLIADQYIKTGAKISVQRMDSRPPLTHRLKFDKIVNGSN